MKLLVLGWMLFSMAAFAGEPQPRIAEIAGPATLRVLKNNVLEVLGAIPTGTRVEIRYASVPLYHNFRDENGEVKKTTNGFHQGLKILSVPDSEVGNFPPEKVTRWNEVEGGLYMGSVDVNMAQEEDGLIPPLPLTGSPDETYLKYFRADGRRITNPYAPRLRERFGAQFNRAIPLSTMPIDAQTKWKKIYAQLVAAADRTHPVSRTGLFLNAGSTKLEVELARKLSEEFEKTEKIPTSGAWSVAVLGTAPRNGFANVPCAEFGSEVIRQVYTRAGYKMSDDFRGENYLIWSNTAAVVNLARALAASGWIPWDPAIYKPMIGAIGMHASANTPGHTFLIAGANGRFIVDNGSPKGRDLYVGFAGRDLIDLMYDIGVFFLPPGIIPEAW